MSVKEKLEKILFEPMRNIRDGHSILSKNFRMPDDPASWLNEKEEYARTLSDIIPQKEPMLRLIKHSLAVLARDNSNDADDLRYRFYSIDNLFKDAEVNEPLLKYSQTQSKKGIKAAKKRWNDDAHREVNEMVRQLSRSDDDPIDLWPHLWAMLDEIGIAAKDIAKPDRCYQHQDLPGGAYKYEAFRRQIRRNRGNS